MKNENQNKELNYNWAIVGYFQGIQKAYFNIGRVFERWTFHYRNAGDKEKTDLFLKQSIKWFQRCVDYYNNLGMGRDSSAAEIWLSDMLLASGDYEKALRMSKTAVTMAKNAQNRDDLAHAYCVLIAVYEKKGNSAMIRKTAMKASKEIDPETIRRLNLDISRFLR